MITLLISVTALAHEGRFKVDKTKFQQVQQVGGFSPVEKYLSKWESSPSRGEKKHI